MIKSFRDSLTEDLWQGRPAKRFAKLQKQAFRKLDVLNSAASLADLSVVPCNRLETLKGDRKGQYSIRINDQWRLCFLWTAEGPADVEIVDYH